MRLEVDETADEVVLRAHGRGDEDDCFPPPLSACVDEPLDGRRMIDGFDGEVEPVTDGPPESDPGARPECPAP
jgi:hypothetical protein